MFHGYKRFRNPQKKTRTLNFNDIHSFFLQDHVIKLASPYWDVENQYCCCYWSQNSSWLVFRSLERTDDLAMSSTGTERPPPVAIWIARAPGYAHLEVDR